MFVTPAPVLSLLLGSQPIVLPVPSLASLFHQPVPIGAALVLVPFMPITALGIVVTVMLFGKNANRCKERSAEYQDC